MTANSKTYPRSLSRLLAVQSLFEMEASRVALTNFLNTFHDRDIASFLDVETVETEYDHTLFEAILKQAVAEQREIDKSVDQALVAKWPIARIDPIFRAIFRAAFAEAQLERTPPKVVISEYIDIARAFDDDKQSIAFTNAVLDHLVKGLQTPKDGSE